MIDLFSEAPSDWRDLEKKVGELFLGLGCKVAVQEQIETVRGNVVVDVYVEDLNQIPISTYLCECKYWDKPVPKMVVHSFRQVVSDFGAHIGFLISKNGFQSGAFEAAKNSNINLLNWEDFVRCFEDRWLKQKVQELHEKGEFLRNYCNPLETFFLDEIKRLSPEKREKLERVISANQVFLAYTYRDWYFEIGSGNYIRKEFELAVKYVVDKVLRNPNIKSYTDYFDFMIRSCEEGLSEIDNLLGKAVRKPKR